MTARPGPVRLHLLRHADAGDPEAWDRPDEVRPVSPKGRRQAERLGAFLAAADFAPDAIVTSPLLRARETAEIVADALRRPVRIDERLGGPLDPETVEAILSEAGDPVRPVLVGHDPAFSSLAGELLGMDRLEMKKGTLARIDLERPLQAGQGVLRWLVPPDLLKA